MQLDLSGLEELGQETSEDQASSASCTFVHDIWIPYRQALLVFPVFLSTSGRDVTTLCRDRVSQSILLRLLLLSCDRRENSAVCIAGKSRWVYVCLFAGKVVILTNCMSDVIGLAMLHVFYRLLSISHLPYVTPLEKGPHLLTSGDAVGCLTLHFLCRSCWVSRATVILLLLFSMWWGL